MVVIVFWIAAAFLLSVFLSSPSGVLANNATNNDYDDYDDDDDGLYVYNDDNEDTTITQTEFGSFELLGVVPHDPGAFTQGLEVLSHEKIGIMKQGYQNEPAKQQQQPLQQAGSPGEDGGGTSNETTTTTRTAKDPPAAETSWLSRYALESTGIFGESSLRIVELASGRVVRQLEAGESYFSEGCTYYYHSSGASAAAAVRIVQITWKSGRGFVYELSVPGHPTSAAASTNAFEEAAFSSLSLVGEFGFSSLTTNGEGWGIVYHPPRNRFLVSDGTSYLHAWELKETATATTTTRTTTPPRFEFELVEKIPVRKRVLSSSGSSSSWIDVTDLNELEWDPYSYGGNTVLANIWYSDEIVRIWVGKSNIDNNNAGKITHVYDLSELTNLADPRVYWAVLNGIAFAYGSSSSSSRPPPPVANATTNSSEAQPLLRGDSQKARPPVPSSKNQFWVTGKHWPKMFLIRLIDDGGGGEGY